MDNKTKPFDIYIPCVVDENGLNAPTKVATIDIEVTINDHGQEMITPKSSALIDKVQFIFIEHHHPWLAPFFK